MSIEAMKQAREALGEDRAWLESDAPKRVWDANSNAMIALDEAIEQAEKQEPVAWRTFDGEGGYDYRTYDMNESYAKEWNERNPKHKGWVEPLYTTTQPQREWVEVECPLCGEMAVAYTHPNLNKEKNT